MAQGNEESESPLGGLWEYTDKLRLWFEKQPREVCIAIAARAALRTIPGFHFLSNENRIAAKALKSIVFPSLRASAAPWLVALVPSEGAALKAAASAYASAALDAAGRADGSAKAAAAAAFSAAATCDDAVRAHDAAVAAAEYAITTARDTSLVIDVAFIDAGGTTAALSARSLWSGGMPDWAAQAWKRLAAALPTDQNWDVWTRWYEARLAGGPFIEEVELFRVMGDPDVPNFWEQAPTKINAAIKAVEEKYRLPPAIEGIPSVYTYGWNGAGKITIIAGPQNVPELPFINSKKDHRQRLQACRVSANDLIASFTQGRYQARNEYKEHFTSYETRLPKRIGSGNFMLADAKAREIRDLFAAEAGILPAPFAAALKVFLEQHIGLRAYYPEVAVLYESIRTGHIGAPLPLDAASGFVAVIEANTPKLFDRSVAEGIIARRDDATTPPITVAPDLPPPGPTDLQPPPDPLVQPDARKAKWFTFAGTANGLWKIFSKGESVAKNVKAWRETAQALKPYIEKILEWLGGGGGPPAAT